YAFVPHAANGRELELDEVKARLASLSGEWDRSGRGFGERVREQVHGLVETSRWQTSFFRRLLALLTQQRHLRQALGRLRVAGREEGIPDDQMHRLLSLARQAHRTALMAAHFEELRGLLASWRYLHRWLALLMFLLATVHIVTAVRYADLRWPELSTLFGVVMGGVQ
ncbi:MAG: hypothetical protein ACE5GW_14020, partial [Planctomycetota bacterium]